MKSKFLTELEVKEIGEGIWELVSPLRYYSELLDKEIEVPSGFFSDFASVPRLPLVYSMYGDRAHRESTLHDWLYYNAFVKRNVADKIFLEAMESRGKSFFIRWGMYLGVRAGGWKAWNEHRRKGHPKI